MNALPIRPLPAAPVLALILLAAAPGARAGSMRVDPAAAYTGGFGLEVWVCVDPLDLPATAGDLEGLFVACDSLSAGGVAVGAAGATLRAGRTIRLEDGFTVPAGADLVLALDPSLSSGFDSVRDESPQADGAFKARFHLDADQLRLGAGDRIDHLTALSAGGEIQFRLSLVPGAAPDEILLALAAVVDGGSYAETAPGGEIPLADGWNLVQVSWSADAGAGALEVAVNGGALTGLTGLANGGAAVDEIRWGAAGGSLAAGWGVLLMDDFAAWEEIVQ